MRILLSLVLALFLCGPAYCTVDNTTGSKNEDKPVTVYEDEEDPNADPQHKVIEQHKLGSGLVKVDISVAQLAPHTVQNFVSAATLFPWPPRPPKVRYNPGPLPVLEKDLRPIIEAEGYSNRTSAQDPYPQGGWRWQFAFHRALNKSKLSVPRSLVGMNAFVNAALVPVKAECDKVNAFEETRVAAFKQVEEFFIENEKILKNEALQKNLNPITMKRVAGHGKTIMTYAQKAPGGKWWLQVEHKMPGLIFHWYQPVVVEANKTTEVHLNESNAISIEGGW